MDLRERVQAEARAAGRAAGELADDAVAAALHAAAALARERRASVLAANQADCQAASSTLDTGMLDRLRLDEARIETLARGLEATAELAPLEREVATWTRPGGLQVSERRVPIGTVGANFEARPNVAVDIAGQLLKSLNAAILRTGGAALRTVTVLVDDVLRPGLQRAGLPPAAVGLVRSPEREGAHVLVSTPALVPLVILRGSGETTAALARVGAAHGVRTLAHAEGGGVIYVHASAARERALALVRGSVDRLGVCNRLNLLLVDRGATTLLEELLALLRGLEIEPRGTARAQALANMEALDVPLGHEWATDAARIATVSVEIVDGLDEATRIANEQTSGLAAAVIGEDAEAAQRFLDAYRGTAAFWHVSPRFTDGFQLTGAPETGINVDHVPGPRGPVSYRDLWLRQYRVIGDGTQRL